MSSWKAILLSFFGGGIAFWISDIVIPAFDRNEQGYAVTVLCPMILLVFYMGVLRLGKKDASGPSTALFALFGVWVLALSFTFLAQQIRAPGPGFSWGDFGYLLISSFLPLRIVYFVALEGSIFALLIGTVAMLVCHFKFETSRWVIPPAVWTLFHHAGK